MKISEIITEAHHSILTTINIEPWRVQIDTHAFANMAARGISLRNFTSIVSYACTFPDILDTIPIGKGAFFQDINTMISVYLHRLSENEIRVETVLSPDMKPKPPMFRRPVPIDNRKDDPKIQRKQAFIAQKVQQQGVDAVSQKLSTIGPISTMNRANRREFSRFLKRKKT
jgi:hypothetical protein